MLPIDTHRDRAIASYRSARFGLFNDFATFLNRISEIMHDVQPPDVVVLFPGPSQGLALINFLKDMFGPDNRLIYDLAFWYGSIIPVPERLEYLVRRHRNLPFLHAIYLEVVLPKVYELVEHGWFSHLHVTENIPMDKFEILGKILMESVYGYNWPSEFLGSPEECAMCHEAMFLRRYTSSCGHQFHHHCRTVHLAMPCPHCIDQLYHR